MSKLSEENKLFGYVRVSTKKQMKQETYKIQRKKINSYIEINKDKYVLLERFEDLGISAFKHRPNFDLMMSKLNNCDGIIITKLSRIGRSVRDLKNIVDKLTELNKIFIVLDNNINTSTPEGRLFFHIFSAFLEYEVELIRERTTAGREKAFEEGVKFGPKKKKLTISNNKIKEYYEKGLGTSDISKIANCSPPTIASRLRDMGIKLRELPHQKKLIKSREKIIKND